MFGLGKYRSKFGKWIDDNGISQQELSDKSGINRNTISKLANEENSVPSWKTQRALIRAMRQYDAEVSAEDFWG